MACNSGSLSVGAARIGVVESMRLRSWKASSALPFHSNGLVFFISWYRGSALSPSRLRNRLTEAKHLVNF